MKPRFEILARCLALLLLWTQLCSPLQAARIAASAGLEGPCCCVPAEAAPVLEADGCCSTPAPPVERLEADDCGCHAAPDREAPRIPPTNAVPHVEADPDRQLAGVDWGHGLRSDLDRVADDARADSGPPPRRATRPTRRVLERAMCGAPRALAFLSIARR